MPRGGLQTLIAYLTERLSSAAPLPPAQALERLCQLLDEIALADDAFIHTAFSRMLSRSQALAMQNLSDQSTRDGHGSQEWSDYLQRGRQALVAALQQQPSLAGLPGVPGSMSEREVIAQLRQGVAGFAAALRAWPTLRQAASGLAAKA